jgi:hypothetical protein
MPSIMVETRMPASVGPMGRAARCMARITFVVALGGTALSAADATAQTPRSRARPANPTEVKRLDSKFDEVQSAFVRETTSLISSYESLGQYERVKAILEAFAKLDPKNEQLKAKIADLDERILEAGEFEVRLQPGEPWQPVGAVTKDRAIRIRVAGEYRFQAAGSLGPDGVADDDPQTGLVPNVPFGAVMGIIMPATVVADAKPPRPFLVGSSFDKPAERDGVLHLRTNVPAGAKCNGRLDLIVSGPQP